LKPFFLPWKGRWEDLSKVQALVIDLVFVYLDMELYPTDVLLRISGVPVVILVNIGKN